MTLDVGLDVLEDVLADLAHVLARAVMRDSDHDDHALGGVQRIGLDGVDLRKQGLLPRVRLVPLIQLLELVQRAEMRRSQLGDVV